MAVIIATPGFWLMDDGLGIDWSSVLHGEQSLRLHRPLSATGDLICRSKVGAVADKGAGKPVLMQYERELIDAENGVPVNQLPLVLHQDWSSEAHPSELQSLLRISYAVLCLKTKRNRKPTMST